MHEDAFRVLKQPNNGNIDFSSNDYLGLTTHPELLKKVHVALSKITKLGSGGSRLLSGNSTLAEQLEDKLAMFYKAETCIIFNSGYEANTGILSCIAGKGDTILMDEYVHASLREGVQLSQAKSFKFKHNSTSDLIKKIKISKGQIFIVLESVYSMDGDLAPLSQIVSIAREYGAYIVLDEAHATGLFGSNGEGLAVSLGLEKNIFARIHTFGKALGFQGACIVGSQELKNYLINFSKPFIYSTAPSFINLMVWDIIHEFLPDLAMERQQLLNNIQYFISKSNYPFSANPTPIQYLSISGNTLVKKTSHYLNREGIQVFPVLSPTVPKGKERIRINLHVFNQQSDIDKLIERVNHIRI